MIDAPVAAFGAAARRWASQLSAVPGAILADFGGANDALVEAFARRRAARPFLAGVVHSEPRAALADDVGARIFANWRSRSDAEGMFDALAAGVLEIDGVTQAKREEVDWRARIVAGDLVRLAEGLLVRSFAERERLSALFGRLPDRVVVDARSDPTVPVVTRSREAGSLVVWAAGASQQRALFLALALDDAPIPVVVVCDAVPHAAMLRATFVPVAQAARALTDARAIVDASLEDPAAAIALARVGAPLAVTGSSGAADWLDGVLVYPAFIRRGVALRAAQLCSLPAPSRNRFAALASPAEFSVDLDVPDCGPLVSVIVPTYNRPALLDRALESVRRQRYRNVEIVVINDAGETVSEVVSRHATTLIEHDTNRGLSAARNTGLRAACGTYIAFLDDDDAYFPEHLAWLVAAMERSRAALAYTSTITQFIRTVDGGLRTYGLLSEFYATVDARDLLVSNALPPVGVMVRRDAAMRAGGFDERLPVLEDHDAWLRIAAHGPIVHVNRIGAMYTRREDGSGMLVSGWGRHAQALRTIYERHPVPADIEARRGHLLAGMTAALPGVPEPPFRFDAIL